MSVAKYATLSPKTKAFIFYYSFMGVHKTAVSELLSSENDTDKCDPEECALYSLVANKLIFPPVRTLFTWDTFRQTVAARMNISIATLGSIIKLNKAREEVLNKHATPNERMENLRKCSGQDTFTAPKIKGIVVEFSHSTGSIGVSLATERKKK